MSFRKFALPSAAAAAAPLAYYLLSEPKRSRTGAAVDENCRLLNLPTPAQAQTVNVLHAPSLITQKEVSKILSSASIARSRGIVGYVERKGDSGRAKLGGDWRTTYLHSGNFFNNSVMDTKELMSRIIKRVEEKKNDPVDDEGWSKMAEFLKKRKVSELHFRTIELHEYGPGGGLPEKKHYDAGSIITIDVMMCDGDKSFEGGQIYCPIYDLGNKEDDNVVLRRGEAKCFSHAS